MPIKQEDFSLKPLKQALHSLEDAISKHRDDLTRDAIIQRFEYTFELSWKTLKKYFEFNNNLREDNVKNLFREAGRHGLVDQVETWFGYHQARNMTSHIYSEPVAKQVFETAKDFALKCHELITRLENVLG